MAREAEPIEKGVTSSDVEIVQCDASSTVKDCGTPFQSARRAELRQLGRGKADSKVASVAAWINRYRPLIDELAHAS